MPALRLLAILAVWFAFAGQSLAAGPPTEKYE